MICKSQGDCFSHLTLSTTLIHVTQNIVNEVVKTKTLSIMSFISIKQAWENLFTMICFSRRVLLVYPNGEISTTHFLTPIKLFKASEKSS